jgi:hypothetical protein
VIVVKNRRKWWVFIDYRELNKDTLKDHFPQPFIDQGLDTLAEKQYFYFLDGFNRDNHIWIALEDQENMTFTCFGGNMPTMYYPLVYAMHQPHLNEQYLVFFYDLLHDCM